MNLQRALTKQTLSNSTIANHLYNTKFTGVSVGDKIEGTNIKTADFANEHKTVHQSTMDKIQEVFKLRQDIQRKNMETVVHIKELGGDITVADAIIYRQHILPLLESYYSTLRNHQNDAVKTFAKAEERYNTSVDNMVQMSSRENGGKALTQDEVNVILKLNTGRKPTMFSQEDNLEELRKLIEFLREELDATLSVVNATTEL